MNIQINNLSILLAVHTMILFIGGKIYLNYQMAEQAVYLSTNYIFDLIIIIEMLHLNV